MPTRFFLEFGQGSPALLPPEGSTKITLIIYSMIFFRDLKKQPRLPLGIVSKIYPGTIPVNLLIILPGILQYSRTGIPDKVHLEMSQGLFPVFHPGIIASFLSDIFQIIQIKSLLFLKKQAN